MTGPKRWARGLAAGAAALALVAGCASEGTTEVATGDGAPALLAQAAERSGIEAHRFTLAVSLSGIPGMADATDIPMAAGEFDGRRQRMTMDLGGLMGAMAPGEALPPELSGDLTMEVVVEDQVMYLRAPMFAALADEPGGGLPPELEALNELGDGWGRIDLTGLYDLPEDVLAALGGMDAYDPRAFLDVVSGAEDARDLGADEIGGVRVEGWAAEVPYVDLMEAQGTDPDEMAALMGPGGPELFAEIADVTVPLEVWIDGDEYVRRLSFDVDLDTLGAATADEDLTDEELALLAGLSMGFTMDFADYGDPTIAVALPEAAVDLTEAFRALSGTG